MKNSISIRNDLKNWSEYKPVPSAESISIKQKKAIENIDKLDSGESVYGPSPLVLKRLAQFKGYQFYPDSQYYILRKEIAKYAKVNVQNVFVSNGADELIDLLLRLTLENGDEVIDCPPTFPMYQLSVILNKGIVKTVQRKKDFSIDTNTILKSINSKTKIIFICTPNNPTGNITSLGEVQKILKTGVLVCVDEAYIEFGGKSLVPLLSKYENLVIIRSFSKWAGIAGLRLGYGLMSSYLIKQLIKIKPPYNVNYAAVIAGIAAIQDKRYREKVIKTIINERKILENKIQIMKRYVIFPSNGNFIFVGTTKGRLQKIKAECEKQGVILRFYNFQLIDFAIRITVGKGEQNNKVINILEKCK